LLHHDKMAVTLLVTLVLLLRRPAVLLHIDKLERERMINAKQDRPNSQLYRIYINEDNELAAVISELQGFKDVYVNLLEKSREKIRSGDPTDDIEYLEIKMMPILLFCVMIEIMLFRSVVKWRVIIDKEMLLQIYSIVYKKVAEIQFELSRFLVSVGFETLAIAEIWKGFRSTGSKPDFRHIDDTYSKVNMGSDIQPVLSSIHRLIGDQKNLNPFS
jgi:hypothetical protein